MCPSGKACHTNPQRAHIEADRLNKRIGTKASSRRHIVYKCTLCIGGWHITKDEGGEFYRKKRAAQRVVRFNWREWCP